MYEYIFPIRRYFMSNQISTDQKNQALFFQLILSFQAAAFQQMGKVKNPFTDKIERDLNQAQLSIDMIDMIKLKTEGNRTPEETKFIDQVLRELKWNFVDELEKDKKSKTEQTQKSEEEQKSETKEKKKTEKKEKS